MPPSPELHPSALAAELWRLQRRGLRSGSFALTIGLVIALLLHTLQGGSLPRQLAYSLAIAVACWITHEAARLLHAAVCDAWRRRRGQPTAQRPGSWQGVWLAVAASIVLGPWAGGRLADALLGQRGPNLIDWRNPDARATLVLTLVGSLVAVAVLSSRERYLFARTQAEAAQRQAAEHQLRLLQSQLEPHMLFNTLANLRVLIGLEPARAQAMLDHLVAYLRSTLAASRADRHPLAAEFERSADYLALMAVRMGERLQTRLALPAALRDARVPPLVLQPLVENAIQHGLEPQVAGGLIEVTASAEDGALVLAVCDSGVGLGAAPRPGGGFGLAQVRERLATLYGGRATFTIEPVAAGGTRAVVRLPLER